jgi:hypothetical protein
VTYLDVLPTDCARHPPSRGHETLGENMIKCPIENIV